MERKKYVILALLVGVITVLGVMYVGDNPDWTMPVSIRSQEISYLTIDIASQSISELTIRITGQDVPVTIEPAAGVTFNIEGDVNATIQGTASVSIDNATVTIDTATIRENVETEGKVRTKWGSKTISSGSFAQLFAYTNTETYDVYLESVGAVGYMDSSPYYAMYLGYGIIVVEVFDASSTLAFDLTYDIAQLPHNFDPAIRIPPNWEIRVYAYNYSPDTRRFEGWILLSYR